MYDDDPVNVYLSVIRDVPPLTPEREAECVRHIRAGDEESDLAQKDLLESVLSLVVEIARRHPSDRIHILELIQIGNQALFAAMRAFAGSDAPSFAAYAEPFVENAVAHAVTTPDR
jgi:DNA-directed RNA polymerase sigma subunit (sigma70/sigma32)